MKNLPLEVFSLEFRWRPEVQTFDGRDLSLLGRQNNNQGSEVYHPPRHRDILERRTTSALDYRMPMSYIWVSTKFRSSSYCLTLSK